MLTYGDEMAKFLIGPLLSLIRMIRPKCPSEGQPSVTTSNVPTIRPHAIDLYLRIALPSPAKKFRRSVVTPQSRCNQLGKVSIRIPKIQTLRAAWPFHAAFNRNLLVV